MIRTFILALAAFIAAAPTPVFPQEKIRVVTTSADLKSLVEAVGGDQVEVESLAAPEQDPHSVEVKPTQLARLRGAALLVKIGLDHEPWLARLPAPHVPVVDASKSVRLLQTETPRLRAERQAHVHAFGNTHYWLDPNNARPITASILEGLIELRPGSKSLFEANREAFHARLDEKIRAWEAALKPYRGTKAIVVHDSWIYFADHFGLDIVAAAEPSPGVPPSPAELAMLLARMQESGVRLLIADPHSNPALVRYIAEKSGAKTVTLLPSGTDYIGLFDEDVRRLSAALKAD
ncbi:metal ABC transporter substrate-binding protein [Microvirga massiliensis]|uniref:metal ABC transporter substrate-binding protein n=1 Tax=Microvirga massiliensis TaxID=1033741 RepID=UPI00062B4DC3|nr:metal ABC transporter substrate-binding protein [Microvirga massiliensis]